MNFVAVDIGASSTRYVSNNGKIGTLPNNMVFINPDTRVDIEPNSEEIENALDVTIEADGSSDFFPVRVLIGAMASRFSGNNQKPTVMRLKHKQKINYVSAVVAAAVNWMKNNLGDSISMYLALPPMETGDAKDYIRAQLLKTFTVTFNKIPGAKVTFSVDDVKCYAESYMAILSYFFDMNGQPREEAKKYNFGNVLSLDIGASTTDLAIVKNMVYQEQTGQTYRTGGNVAREYLINALRDKYGFDVPHESADMAMAEGRIQMGNTYDDISGIVANAKQRFAESVVESMQGYFRMVNIPIQSIRAIVVSGGGSMRSEYVDKDSDIKVTSEPMSYYITKELNQVCPGVAVEHYSNNPRMANISGLFVRANVDIRKKSMSKNS